jgi:hypothetical protein
MRYVFQSRQSDDISCDSMEYSLQGVAAEWTSMMTWTLSYAKMRGWRLLGTVAAVLRAEMYNQGLCAPSFHSAPGTMRRLLHHFNLQGCERPVYGIVRCSSATVPDNGESSTLALFEEIVNHWVPYLAPSRSCIYSCVSLLDPLGTYS